MCLCFFGTMAQVVVLGGRVNDMNHNRSIAQVTVSLFSTTDSIKSTTITDSSGRFTFYTSPGNYRLQLSAVGFLQKDTLFTLSDTEKDLGILKMFQSSDLLDEVVIKATTPPVRQKGDTVEYSSGAFKVNPDANAEDLVRKMPGITVEQGTVKAGGEEVRKVTVDGREFFGEDASAALKNLPAEIIDKVQVFDRLSEQAQQSGFEDDQTAKGINIITKANMRNGQFGRIYAGYGTDERYAAGGNVTIFNGDQRISIVGQINNVNQQNFATEDLLGVTSNSGGGRNRGGGRGGGNRGGNNARGFSNSGSFLVGQQSGISKTGAAGINFSDAFGKKLTLSGSYFFNDTRNTADEILNRQYFISGDSSRFYNDQTRSSSDNQNHRLNLRMEYKIDSANTIIVTPRISFQNNQSFNALNGFNSLGAKTITSETGNLTNNASRGINIDNNILYRHSFPKRGRTISINVNTGLNNRAGENYLDALNRSYDFGGNESDSLKQFSDRRNNGYQIGANISYTEPLGKKSQLQLSYRPSYSHSDADQQTYLYDFTGNKYSLLDTSLSNKFKNDYITHNGGVTFRLNSSKTNQFTIGLAYQSADLSSEQAFPYLAEVRRNFSNLLPTAVWNTKLSSKSSLRFMYRTNTSAPSISQLQNVINNSNPLVLRSGNADLKQQYAHNLITRYTYTNTASGISVLGNIFIQKMNGYIGNATYIAASDSLLTNTVTLYQGSQLLKPVNLDNFWNIRSFVTLGLPLKFIKSNLNLNNGYTYSFVPGIINGENNLSRNQSYNTGLVLSSNISEYIDFNLSYNANFSTVKNSLQPGLNNKYFNQSAGLQMNLLTKNGWLLQNDINNQLYNGLSDGFNQSFWLWNLSVGKKFLKKQAGELKLSVFDLLKQNQSINRNISESFIDDVQTRVLQQYFMLTFTYKLRNFGSRLSR